MHHLKSQTDGSPKFKSYNLKSLDEEILKKMIFFEETGEVGIQSVEGFIFYTLIGTSVIYILSCNRICFQVKFAFFESWMSWIVTFKGKLFICQNINNSSSSYFLILQGYNNYL